MDQNHATCVMQPDICAYVFELVWDVHYIVGSYSAHGFLDPLSLLLNSNGVVHHMDKTNYLLNLQAE